MDYRSLVNKLEAISNGVLSEATAPATFKPTHFHKGNLGNKLPVMQAPDGSWWWEGGNTGEPGASKIVPWQGDTLNRSGWNPASIDGIIDAAGKYVEFDAKDNWQTFKGRMDALDADAKKTAELKEKLKQLLALVEKYLALKAKKGKPGAKPATTPTPAPQAFEGTISKNLLESFGYEAHVDEVAVPAGVASAGGAVSKVLGKAMPGVGAALGAQGAYDSYKKGDYLGAALNGLSGAFSLVPGLGWIPAVGFGMWQAGREISGAADAASTPQPKQQGAKPVGDPKIQLLQKKLAAAGATNIDGSPLALDGKMGPNTQAAMKQFPNIKEGTDMNQPKSVAESIRELQQRLEMIETHVEHDPNPFIDSDNDEQANEGGEPAAEPATGEENAMAKQLEQAGGKLMEKDGRQFIVLPDKGVAVEVPSMEIVDASTPALKGTGKQFNPAEFGLNEELEEGIWDTIAKGAAKLGKGAASAAKDFKYGLQKPGEITKYVKGGATGKYSPAAIGAKIAKNPLKTGAAAGAAGLGLGLAAGGGGASAKPVPGGTGGGSNTPAPAVDTSADDAEMEQILAQIKALMKDLSTSQDPEIQQSLAKINAQLGNPITLVPGNTTNTTPNSTPAVTPKATTSNW